jgi:hypothetical protein
MYGLTRRHLGSLGAPQDDEQLVMKNALVESSLLHTRILTDILLSRGKFDDDVNLNDLIQDEGISNNLVEVIDVLNNLDSTAKCNNG